MLRTRANLSFTYAYILTLRTHFAKPAQNESPAVCHTDTHSLAPGRGANREGGVCGEAASALANACHRRTRAAKRPRVFVCVRLAVGAPAVDDTNDRIIHAQNGLFGNVLCGSPKRSK